MRAIIKLSGRKGRCKLGHREEAMSDIGYQVWIVSRMGNRPYHRSGMTFRGYWWTLVKGEK